MSMHEWKPATGQLIYIRHGGTRGGDRSGGSAGAANSVLYLMEVTPDSGGEPLRCECTPPALMAWFWSPPFGDPVRMECIPVEPKARFGRDDPANSRTTAESWSRAEYEEVCRPIRWTTASDPVGQVAQLTALHSGGALSDAQFEAMKALLIGLPATGAPPDHDS
jgi:hypothetical protein